VKLNCVWLRYLLHKQNLSSKHNPSRIDDDAAPIIKDLKIELERKQKENKITITPIIQ
jgi:hypothetical protein